MNHYTLSKEILEDAIRAERVDRFASHKLAHRSPETVRAVRRLYAEGEPIKSLAIRTGVTTKSIYNVVTFRTYKHIV